MAASVSSLLVLTQAIPTDINIPQINYKQIEAMQQSAALTISILLYPIIAAVNPVAVAHARAQAAAAPSPNDIGKIAGKYKNLECVEAASDVQIFLKKNGQKGSRIVIKFDNSPRGFIVSLSKGGDAISTTAFHVGIQYKGRVYCNVHPYGLPKQQWIDDFEGLGIKRVYEFIF